MSSVRVCHVWIDVIIILVLEHYNGERMKCRLWVKFCQFAAKRITRAYIEFDVYVNESRLEMTLLVDITAEIEAQMAYLLDIIIELNWITWSVGANVRFS